ncbi:MAG: SDR family NAD(P)-dependent oxidoreductase [Cellulosilyticaceae bacterium]
MLIKGKKVGMAMGKIVLITGANSGIGRAAALQFAREGYTVVLGCRNLERGKEAQEYIIEESRNQSIDLMEVDMGSFESIRQFCEAFKARYRGLDILIHNAGCFNHGVKTYQQSVDGIELTFAINMCGPVLMTRLLKPCLEQSEDARIIIGSSNNILHFFDERRKIDFERIMDAASYRGKYDSYKMYGDSKMAITAMGIRLAEDLVKDGITINTLMIDGAKMSKTALEKFPLFPWRMMAYVQNVFLKSTEYMANRYFEMATEERFLGVTGKVVNGRGEIIPSNPPHMTEIECLVKGLMRGLYYPAYGDDLEVQEQLWKLCEQVGII